MGRPGGGVPAAIIRFICHIPIFYYMSLGREGYTLVKNDADTLLAPPLSRIILVGEAMAGTFGIFAAVWNFVMWIPTIFCPDNLLGFMGFVDSAIVIIYIAITAIEGTYIGKTKGQCASFPSGDTGTDDHRIIFFRRVAALLKSQEDYAQEKCGQFRTKFNLGIALIVLYGIAAICNVTVGIQAWRTPQYQYRNTSFGRNRRGGRRIHRSWKVVIGDAVRKFVYHPFVRLVDHVMSCYEFVAAKVRGTKPRARVQRFQKGMHKRMTSAHTSTQYLLDRVRGRIDPPVVKALQVDAILFRIAMQLHYVELAHLGVASKRVHAAIFETREGGGDASKKCQLLQELTCQRNTASECWACGIRVCQQCISVRRSPPSKVSLHVQLCRATCSDCFNAHVHASGGGCSCKDGLHPLYTFYQRHHQLTNLCARCIKLKESEILQQRQITLRKQHEEHATEGLTCDKCSRDLGENDPVWWVCSKCSAQCQNEDHARGSEKLGV